MAVNDDVIYLDNAATTKMNKDVLDSYNRASDIYFGNPSSIHGLGQSSARLLDLSRKQVLEVMGLVNSHDVIFTSGATEANNLAIIGFALAHRNRGKHIITTVYEHPSVLESCAFLEREFGFEVTYLPVSHVGLIDINNLRNSIRDDTILVSIMAVNNEIGAINFVEEIGTLLKEYPKIAYHVDAVQSIAKIPQNYAMADMITITAHKIHGPRGIGCLIKNKKITLTALNNGGGQEGGERSGTVPCDLCACLAKTLKMALIAQPEAFEKVKVLRDKLIVYLFENSDKYEMNSTQNNPFIVNFSLKDRKASVVVEALSNNRIMVSSISACHSKGESGSYVVKALGKDEHLYHNTIRVSFDESNTVKEIDKFIETLDRIVKEVKQ